MWFTESEGEALARLHEQAGQVLEKAGSTARFQTLVSLDVTAVTGRLRRERPATLLLPAAMPLASREHLPVLLDAVRGAVMLVR